MRSIEYFLKMFNFRLPKSATVCFSIFLTILVTTRGQTIKRFQRCMTQKCMLAAAEVLLSRNQSVNPCDDFYEHACGGWIEMNPINPLSRSHKSHFSDLSLYIQAEISELFNKTGSSDIESLQKSKKFYESCTDLVAIEGRGLTHLESILIQNGEWPLSVPSDKWNPQNLKWQQIHENFVKIVNIPAVYDVKVELNRENSSLHILSLTVPIVPSGQKRFFLRKKRDSTRTGYRFYVRDVAKEIKKLRGFTVDINDFYNDVMKMVALEDELDKLATLPEQKDNDNGTEFRITTIEALQKDWNNIVAGSSNYSINWLQTINDRLNETGITIDLSEKIALKPGTVITDLARLLANTTTRTIVNYIHWKVIDTLLPLTNSSLRNPTKLVAVAADRLGRCINDHKMVHAVSYMYAKNYFDSQSRTTALEMVENILQEMKQEIGHCSWLDDETKSAARKKIDGMMKFIGYPEWYDEPRNLDDYYKELNVGLDYFENVLVFNKFMAMKKLRKLRSIASESETEWIALPHIVNAEYDPPTNSLSFPAAILQSPMFVYERPSVLNYGGLGAIAGHEISHGFDNLGRLYDEHGNKRNWWTQSTADTYKTKAQCFIDQYNKYLIYEDQTNNKTVYVDGAYTQDENIADTTGFRAGLRAYKKAKNEGKINNVKIPYLQNITDDQLYFYAVADTLCESVSDRGLATYESDTHSPNHLRIIGALSNMQEFADAFNCPVGSRMNPVKKCLLWD